MKCADVKELIESVYEGAKITDKDALAHIDSCASCRAEYDAALEVRDAISSFDAGRVPADFNKGVWEKAGVPAPGVRLLPDMPLPGLKWAGAAAAAIAVVVLISTALDKKNTELTVKPETPVQEKIIRKEAPVKKQPEQAPVVAQEKPAPMHELGTEREPEKMLAQEPPRKAEPVVPSFAAQPGQEQPAPAVSSQQPSSGIAMAAAEKTKKVEVTVTPSEAFEGNILVKHNVFRPLKGEKVTVKYKLSEASNVLARVYDRSGKYVRILRSGMQESGVHEVSWDGRDESGNVAGDGIYLMIIKTGAYEEKIKVVVLK